MPDDEKKRGDGAGSVKVFFVQTQPVANALSPSSVQVPVVVSSTSNVQVIVFLLGPR